jgi:Fe-S-cluster containining protein
MEVNFTDALCTHCGLCCNGSLFADVELAGGKEMSGVEVMGLEVEEGDDGEGLLLQPCAALKEKRCTIYPYRPNCCRTFECQLLRKVKSGAVPLEQARSKVAEVLRQIERTEERIAHLHQGDERRSLKERYLDALALSANTSKDTESLRKFRDLEMMMGRTEEILQNTFLRS